MSEIEDDLVSLLAETTKDPYLFVVRAFPWGEEGELQEHEGPDEWQTAVLKSIRDGLLTIQQAVQVAVASGHGVGKALAHGEPVLTPFGWRQIESLSVGDDVIAGDGSATKVTGVFPQGERELFRVYIDDGSSVVVDGEHLWFTTSRSERKHGKSGRVRTTKEIAQTLKFPNGPQRGLNHEIPVVTPVAHPTALLPIEPYLFGCWLGDGDAVGRITGKLSTFEALEAVGANLGSVVEKAGTVARTRSALGIRPALRALKMYGCRAHEKSIPRCYMHADTAQRTSLLQGLMDTDGTVGKNNAVVFEVVSEALADNTAELARSLGGVVRRGVRWGQYNGKQCRKVYRLYLSLPMGLSPFRLPEKANRYRPDWGNRNCDRTRKRFIENIEPVGFGKATCITINHPSKLFVTRDHIVTHNSALVAWLVLWALSTHEYSRGVVTANTETQLRTKTWPELARWFRLFIAKDWFTFTATSVSSSNEEDSKSWRIDAIPWSESRTESFAGLHNQGKRLLVICDEASAIPDIIWETIEGALTDKDTEIIWAVFGNPTRNTGRFRECFGRFKHRWKTWQIDSRKTKMANKAQIAKWVEDYGEDSDFVRVRVRGEFPRAGSMQFISADLVEAARKREPYANIRDPLVMSVDVARFGDDQSIICFRRGRDAVTIPWIKFRNVDTMTLAARVVDEANRYKPDAIFVDGGGVGGGVVDRLRMLKLPVVEVQFGSKPDRSQDTSDGAVVYANKRAEIWGTMRDWLIGGTIPDDPELAADLTGVEYGYAMKDGRDAIQLERKEDMKKRGLASPDMGDALALSLSYPVVPSDHSRQITGQPLHTAAYDSLGRNHINSDMGRM